MRAKIGFWKWYWGKIKRTYRRLETGNRRIGLAAILIITLLIIITAPWLFFLLPILITVGAYYVWRGKQRKEGSAEFM